MFGLNRGQSDRRTDLSPDDLYRESLAVWQIEHDANSMDMTTEQRERFRVFVRVADWAADPQHPLFGRWLVSHGGVSDAVPTDTMLDRAIAVRETGTRPALEEIE